MEGEDGEMSHKVGGSGVGKGLAAPASSEASMEG